MIEKVKPKKMRLWTGNSRDERMSVWVCVGQSAPVMQTWWRWGEQQATNQLFFRSEGRSRLDGVLWGSGQLLSPNEGLWRRLCWTRTMTGPQLGSFFERNHSMREAASALERLPRPQTSTAGSSRRSGQIIIITITFLMILAFLPSRPHALSFSLSMGPSEPMEWRMEWSEVSERVSLVLERCSIPIAQRMKNKKERRKIYLRLRRMIENDDEQLCKMEREEPFLGWLASAAAASKPADWLPWSLKTQAISLSLSLLLPPNMYGRICQFLKK